MQSVKKIAIIGSGFSALAAACYLAKAGHEVSVFEKANSLGGRARQFERDGFTFDMGPSWYWMPDVFEKFFSDFDKKPSDYYKLEKLSPGYQVFFGINDKVVIDDDYQKIRNTFENIEKGSGKALDKFIANAKDNYEIAIKDIVYRPGESPFELVSTKTIKKLNQFFGTISSDVAKGFKNHKLKKIVEFPVLFLGAKPSKTPSFYSFMNFADFGLGTWQPTNGFFDVVQAMVSLGKELGVTFTTNAAVTKIETSNLKIKGIIINDVLLPYDSVVSGADYHHTESLLDYNLKQYSEKYWDKKTFAPSSLLFYVGFDKKLTNVSHHNLFFDTNFDEHASSIYDKKEWPKNPLFYANFTSITNSHTAPKDCENGFFLIPLAPDLEDTEEIREKYFEEMITRFEKITQQDVKKNILFKQSFCVNDFKSEYNSYKGNAYGLANTLLQTAFLRPRLRSNKVKNLFFTGQLTVPGPGVPPALISGKLVSELVLKYID